jgi:hypothetical protein
VARTLHMRAKHTANLLSSLYLDSNVDLKIDRAAECMDFYGTPRSVLAPDYRASFVVGDGFQVFSSRYHHAADDAIAEAIVMARNHVAEKYVQMRKAARDSLPVLVHHIPHDHQIMCYGCLSNYPRCIKCRVCNGHAYIGLYQGAPRRINWTRLCKRQVYSEQASL